MIAGLSFLFVATVIFANLGCAPMYFERGDVIAGLSLAAVWGLLLAWAASGDDDRHRWVGASVCAGVAAIFVGTASIPALFAPIALAGCLRLPRATRLRLAMLVSIPLVAIATAVAIIVGMSTVIPQQFRCP